MNLKNIVFIITILLLTGCSGIKPQTHVTSIYPESVTNNIIKKYFEDGEYQKLKDEFELPATTEARKDWIADKIVRELLTVHLREYSEFTNILSADRAFKNTIAKTSSLALTTLATILTPTNTINALAGGASFITGANETHENENYGNKPTSAMINAMEALRLPIKIQLETELQKSNTNLYYCEQLLIEYEESASIEKALNYLNELAAASKNKQQLLYNAAALKRFQ